MSSQVEIVVDGTDVTTRVIYASAVFESQQNAVPGTFEITLKDPDRTYTPPNTGCEITMALDGTRHFGGYVTQITRKFALPVDEIPADSRLWVLRGVDWNILFDKRVTRNTSNYTRHLPKFRGDKYDGELIRQFVQNYLDLPGDMHLVTEVEDIAYPFFLTSPDATRVGAWKQQGTPWREQMELMAQWSGAVWYISPEKYLHFHPLESATAPFGFSDEPNGTTTIGMRDVTATVRGGPEMTNDALIWGGSEWSEDVVFAREENASSISDHNRWQEAEHHFGEDGYKLQQGVDARADIIVNGHSAALGLGFNPGKAFPQHDISLTWFAENQPAGQQILAGQIVSTRLNTFGSPYTPMLLPMRSVRITFPGVDPSGFGHVQLSGSMGLSLNDPFFIWQHLRNLRRQRNPIVSVALDSTEVSTYGGFGQYTPTLVSGNIYELPNETSYIAGTTQVYKDGLLQARGTDYTESDPVAGRITFATDPGSAELFVVVRTG